MRPIAQSAAVLATASLWLTVCSAAGAPSAGPSPRSASSSLAAQAVPVPLQVRAAYASAAGSELPLFATVDGGFFGQNGLDVSVTRISGGSTGVLQALVGRSIDVAQIGGSAPAEAAVHGVQVVVIAEDYNRLIASIWAKDPAIRSIQDLKGKTIGITNVRTVSDFYARLALENAHLVPGRDVGLLGVGGIENCFAALNFSRLEACVLLSPYTILAPGQGFHEILNLLEVRVLFMLNGLVVTKEYEQRHRATLVAFVKAYMQAIRRLKSDPAFGKRVLSHWLLTKDTAALADAYILFGGQYLRNPPTPTAASIQTVIDLLKGQEPAFAGLDPYALIDASIAADAGKALGLPK